MKTVISPGCLTFPAAERHQGLARLALGATSPPAPGAGGSTPRVGESPSAAPARGAGQGKVSCRLADEREREDTHDDGVREDQIAGRLFLSVATVKTHVAAPRSFGVREPGRGGLRPRHRPSARLNLPRRAELKLAIIDWG